MNYFENIYESIEKSIFDYLAFPPEGGKGLKIANKISEMKSEKEYVYRGMSPLEWKNLQELGTIQSFGQGNTRDIEGSYVSDSIQLAGRFAYRNWLDNKTSYLVVFDRSKLPTLNRADPGNYWTEFLHKKAIVRAYKLQSDIKRVQ